jgi:hypothetical protein
MSFLWRSNTGSSTEDSIANSSTCKLCVENQKRLKDYELFFNEVNQTLKQKDREVIELNKKSEEIDLDLQTQKAFRDKLIEQIENIKHIYASEKKQWLEDKAIWLATRKQFQEDAMNWEVEKSNLEDTIHEFQSEKVALRNLSKQMESKISKLNEAIREWEQKFEDYKVRSQKNEQASIQAVKDLGEKRYKSRESELLETIENNKQEYKQLEENMLHQLNEFWQNKLKQRESELIGEFELLKANMKDREEIAVETIRDLYAERLEMREQELLDKLEEMESESRKKEEDWRIKEDDYEFNLQCYQDNEKEYEYRLQEMKYDTVSEMERLIETYEKKEALKDLEWEKRVQELNESFDEEYHKFKDLLKLKDAEFESEKDNIESVLKSEIERLKQENTELESKKKEVEKERMELFLDNRGLAADNHWLEAEWKEQSTELQDLKEETDNLRKTLVQTQQDYDFLKYEYHANQKALEETITNIANQTHRGTQTEEVYTEEIIPLEESETSETGIRQRKIKKKKNFKPKIDGSKSCIQPAVLEKMNKDEEKKNYEKADVVDYLAIDISDEEKEHPMYDHSNFFLHLAGSQSEKIKQLEEKIDNYEKEMDKIKALNSEYVNKINFNECKSLFEFNRKLRLGIPVRFYPSHTKTSKPNTVKDDFELH